MFDLCGNIFYFIDPFLIIFCVIPSSHWQEPDLHQVFFCSDTTSKQTVLNTYPLECFCFRTSSLLTPSPAVSRLLSSSDSREASPWLLVSWRDTSSWSSSTWACSCWERPRATSTSCHASESWKHTAQGWTHTWTRVDTEHTGIGVSLRFNNRWQTLRLLNR